VWRDDSNGTAWLVFSALVSSSLDFSSSSGPRRPPMRMRLLILIGTKAATDEDETSHPHRDQGGPDEEDMRSTSMQMTSISLSLSLTQKLFMQSLSTSICGHVQTISGSMSGESIVTHNYAMVIEP